MSDEITKLHAPATDEYFGGGCPEPFPTKLDIRFGGKSFEEFTEGAISRRQFYAMHEAGQLPTFKVGGRVGWRVSTMLKYFEDLEGETTSKEK